MREIGETEGRTVMANIKWPENLPVVQVRMARPTRSLQAIIRFYCEGLELEIIGSFAGHANYSGVMIGLPNRDYHLEFTEHEATQRDYAPPSADNLLVFYLPDGVVLERTAARLAAMGFPAVAPENPYWREHGITIEDPDGWRIVLMNTAGI